MFSQRQTDIRQTDRQTFIPGYCLNDLLKSNREEEQANNDVKSLISSALDLAYHDLKKLTVVNADVSSYDLGDLLLLEHDVILKPVAFYPP